MITPQFSLDLNNELIVDNFAGGGGASTGIELALGRNVDIAINHDKEAVALHAANHPQTKHFCEDVFKIDPRKVTGDRPIGLAWFSPDCKHFSKAKGGKPRSKKIRGLAWIVVKWAAIKRPRVIILENVEEFQQWGPLREDGSPCPDRKGKTFRNWIARLTNLGYSVEWRELRACDYGAPTIRKRLYLIARCDGRPIMWPAQTHTDPSKPTFRASGLKPWRTAAECIIWTLPTYSIFLTKEQAREFGVKRPLADATMRRIAKGVYKFVINAKEPFIVPLTHQGSDRVESCSEPFRTITGAHRGEKALAVPHLTQYYSPKRPSDQRVKGVETPLATQTTEPRFALTQTVVAPLLTEHANGSTQRTFNADEPMRTQCAECKGGHFALVSAFLAKHYTGVVGNDVQQPIGTVTSIDHHTVVAGTLVQTGYGERKGQQPRVPGINKPLGTVVAGGVKHAVVASHLTKFYGTNTGQEQTEPLHSVTALGQHLAEVRAFLVKYYGNEKDGCAANEPIHTIPCVDRFGLVMIHGQPYAISDIGIRMLSPRELYRGQGFPDSYKIEIQVDAIKNGKPVRKKLTGEAQVRMCGNSVCPPVAAAIVAANVPEMAVWNLKEKRRYARQNKPAVQLAA
jgi:DNA (cytosine-5)-methyltransferase 1